MLIQLTYVEAAGPSHVVEGIWPTTTDALNWARDRGAVCAIATPIKVSQ